MPRTARVHPFALVTFFLSRSIDRPDLNSFPTRRSSDLPGRRDGGQLVSREVGEHHLARAQRGLGYVLARWCSPTSRLTDRKSTRLNSSHSSISYAVLCLEKKTAIVVKCLGFSLSSICRA